MFRGGKPWLISTVVRLKELQVSLLTWFLYPELNFHTMFQPADDFIPYPEVSGLSIKVDSFLIDKYPVTNAQYYEFIQSTGYRPADTTGYLRHWEIRIFINRDRKDILLSILVMKI